MTQTQVDERAAVIKGKVDSALATHGATVTKLMAGYDNILNNRRLALGELGFTGFTQQATTAAPAPPPAGGTPGQNAAWWAALSPGQQESVLHEHPEWLGNLDGLPGSVRSAANVARLPIERAALLARIDALTRGLPAGINPDDPILPLDWSYQSDRNAVAEIAQLKGKVADLDSIESTLAQGNRQLLTLDTSGRRVTAAVAVGDVDTAGHVAVFVPGFTSNVQDSLASYDHDMYNMQAQAQRISDQAGDRGTVATVTWLGYEAPQVLEVGDPSHSVALDQAARAGAPRLDGFLNGIGAAHDASVHALHLTALGHSYGSLTTGIALQQPTPVQDAVVFGSPGMDITRASDLAVPAGHVYSEMAAGDPVPDADATGHFGTSPYAIHDIHRLSTDSATDLTGQALTAVTGHTAYLTNRSTSQYDMAAVVAGRPDLAVTYQPHAAQAGTVPTPPEAVPAPPPSPDLVPTPPPRPDAAAPSEAVPTPPPMPR